MRRIVGLAVLLGCASIAGADPAMDAARAEMAAALVEQADLHPTPLSLPTAAAAPGRAAAASAVKRGTGPRASEAAGTVANQVSQRAEARAASQAAHQAQAAAAAAAGQAQSRAAKERASRPRPR